MTDAPAAPRRRLLYVVSEDFAYSDGPLAANATWLRHSGASNQLQVLGERALLDGGQCREVRRTVAAVTRPWVHDDGHVRFAGYGYYATAARPA